MMGSVAVDLVLCYSSFIAFTQANLQSPFLPTFSFTLATKWTCRLVFRRIFSTHALLWIAQYENLLRYMLCVIKNSESPKSAAPN